MDVDDGERCKRFRFHVVLNDVDLSTCAIRIRSSILWPQAHVQRLRFFFLYWKHYSLIFYLKISLNCFNALLLLLLTSLSPIPIIIRLGFKEVLRSLPELRLYGPNDYSRLFTKKKKKKIANIIVLRSSASYNICFIILDFSNDLCLFLFAGKCYIMETTAFGETCDNCKPYA